MRIKETSVRTVLDSRQRPTIETTLSTDSFKAVASIPSGKSTGSHEAKELRDKDGGVESACENVRGEITKELCSHDFSSLQELDTFLCELDGTSDKSRLGANAILSVSIAFARLFAQEANVPLWHFLANAYSTTPAPPRLFVNVMNGGAHAHFRLPMQEHILVVGENTMAQSVQTIEKAFADLGDILRAELPELPMGDEGGYSPTFDTLDRPFEILSQLVATYPNTSIAIDAAANELRTGDHYTLMEKEYSSEELQNLYTHWVSNFPFHAVEDPFAEDDAASFTPLTAALGDKVLIIGDDLIVTNPARIEDAIEHKYINSVLIKPNQIGTVSEAAQAVQKTHAAGWATVASHRSGETEDVFIADFAWGMGMHGIKAGGLGQEVRRAKYERLRVIEEEARTF